IGDVCYMDLAARQALAKHSTLLSSSSRTTTLLRALFITTAFVFYCLISMLATHSRGGSMVFTILLIGTIQR
ncbi:hypothetical protein, partial [Vibrio metoecus]|uniref:hypothetical protein n=1 Tax=Vibrio metoecus TaxID=1481663 RepID=UPI001C3EB9A1